MSPEKYVLNYKIYFSYSQKLSKTSLGASGKVRIIYKERTLNIERKDTKYRKKGLQKKTE